jgi:dienelactone hydrolase
MRNFFHKLAFAFVFCILNFAFFAQSQTPPNEIYVADLKEEVVRINVIVKDLYGRLETRAIPITIYRPDGNGPYPFVVFNHGRAPGAKRASQGRFRPEHVARYLVAKGLVVFVPMRVGYGETYGDFDPEYSGTCRNPSSIETMSIAASDQVLAVSAYAHSLPYVDATRWLVAGQSVGGLAAVATVGRKPKGLLGGINFSGGTGGDPDQNPSNPCGPQRMSDYWGTLASQGVPPMLWLYWQNDKYWGENNPKAWHKAWVTGGGSADFESFPPAGLDGHSGLNIDMSSWLPVVDVFLTKLGFSQTAIVSRPPATTFSTITSLDDVPVNTFGKAGYAKFLESKLPRAFAVGERNGWGFATGDYPLGKALGNCQRSGQKCRLYAVDNDVVWLPPVSDRKPRESPAIITP